ncbi:MAG: GtrA family protein [Bacteroidota bacterium]
MLGIPDELLHKIFRFGVVGCTGFILDFGLTYLLKEKAKWQKYLSSAIAFAIAATSNYFLNRTWTFQSHNPQILTEYTMFIGVSVVGLLISLIVIYILHGWAEKHFYVSKLMAVFIVMVWNFLANYFFTFHS